MRKLTSVRQIKQIINVPNTDFLQVATVDGWQVIINKKDNLKVGDNIIYCEIDSVFPKMSCYDFLKNNNYRIKTKKIKGVLSQGIIFPLSILYNYINENLTIDYLESYINTLEIGSDLTEYMKITKYVPIEKENKITNSLPFPDFLNKTNEERIQNLSRLFDENNIFINESEFTVTEKLDGSSFTVYKKDGKIGICSKNYEIDLKENNNYTKIFNQYNFNQIFENIDNICIQGEIIGEKIQGNPYRINGLELYIYNIIYLSDNYKFTYNEMDNFIKSKNIQNNTNLKLVPLVINGVNLKYSSLNDILNLSSGVSCLNKNTLREGIVVREYDNLPLIIENVKIKENFSFKIISNEYLLKGKN